MTQKILSQSEAKRNRIKEIIQQVTPLDDSVFESRLPGLKAFSGTGKEGAPFIARIPDPGPALTSRDRNSYVSRTRKKLLKLLAREYQIEVVEQGSIHIRDWAYHWYLFTAEPL